LEQRQKFINSTKWEVLSDFQINESSIPGELVFHSLDNSDVYNGLFAIENNVLYFTDQHNFSEKISWPTNFVTEFHDRPVLLHSAENSYGYVNKAFLFGSSISWFHFLIEILPRFLKFSKSDFSQRTPEH
jgi:hypothetical protein